MHTDCTSDLFGFQDLGSRKVVAGFDGGMISSDAGGLLLREVALATELLRQFSACFVDYRNQRFVEHSVQELVSQKAIGLCLGYEDVVDHEMLRFDPLFATLCGKEDPSGESRRHQRDRGKACAGKSTLNRLETCEGFWIGDKKIVADTDRIERFFVKAFVNNHRGGAPRRIILDLDVTDNELHGKQEGRFFHGHYDCYCYLPLYIYCGDDLLAVKLRTADADPAEGVTEELDRVVGLIRSRWKHVQIVIRGDSGLCREELMRWCEDRKLFYVLGLARNTRLVDRIKKHLRRSHVQYARTGLPARRYLSFYYRTRQSWSRSRRVIAKAEYTEGKENPRFIVSNLPREELTSAQDLYEKLYCARGEMENRIKEQQLYLFADRSSCMTMKANQLRLWFSALAYVLMNELRRRALQGTELAQATCQTIRLKLFKIGALVRVSVRRVAVSFSTGYPYRELFLAAYRGLRCAAAPPG
jgi:hypothetical protein